MAESLITATKNSFWYDYQKCENVLKVGNVNMNAVKQRFQPNDLNALVNNMNNPNIDIDINKDVKLVKVILKVGISWFFQQQKLTSDMTIKNVKLLRK